MMSFFINLRLSLVSLIRIVFFSKWRGILKSTNSSKKSGCIIIGNGPSFKQTIEQHGEHFQNFDLVAVNNFATSFYFEQLKPSYYIINATILFLPDDKQSLLYQNMKREFFQHIVSKTTWDMEIMVPFMAKKSTDFQAILHQNNHLKPLYFNLESIEGFAFLKNRLFQLGLGCPRPHNVIIPALMNMMYLQYKTIHVVGADHSWLPQISVNEENIALVNQQHFYDEQESKAAPMQDRAQARKLHEILEKFMLSFKGYWEIKAYAQSRGVSIYNSSEVSYIDAFERKKWS